MRGSTTASQRAALRDALADELAALRARFDFDDEDVVRVFGVLAVVTTRYGVQIIIDPLSMLLPLLASAPDGPLALAPRH